MSTRIMSACWPLQMPPTAKAVLISLADNANDDGFCWPSIAHICERTCFKKNAVIDAIAWLEHAGCVQADRGNGRHTTYTITPESFNSEHSEPSRRSLNRLGKATGRAKQPVGQSNLNRLGKATNRLGKATEPVGQSNTNRQEPSRTVSRTVNITAPPFDASRYLKDLGVESDISDDWLRHRKMKKALPTKTAIDGIASEAMKAGVTLSDALRECCQRGWIGFKADWLRDKGGGRESPEERRRRENERGAAILGIDFPRHEKTIDGEVLHA